MPVRLKDIADDLGISMITVSKVLRDKPDVSEQTRRRVLQRVKEVNYRPNMMARGLASGKSYTVGLIVPDLVHTFFAELAKGLSGALRRHSYQLVLASAEEDPNLERDEIDKLLARGVDALLIASCQTDPKGLSALARGNIPYVLIDRMLPKLKAHFVGTNDLEADYIATEHLIQLGRERIAHEKRVDRRDEVLLSLDLQLQRGGDLERGGEKRLMNARALSAVDGVGSDDRAE